MTRSAARACLSRTACRPRPKRHRRAVWRRRQRHLLCRRQDDNDRRCRRQPVHLQRRRPKQVTDFSAASRDKPVFSNSGFDLGLSGAIETAQKLPGSLFVANNAGKFTTTTQRFAYDTQTGQLYYDAGGSATPTAQHLVVTLDSYPALVAGNLFFIEEPEPPPDPPGGRATSADASARGPRRRCLRRGTRRPVRRFSRGGRADRAALDLSAGADARRALRRDPIGAGRRSRASHSPGSRRDGWPAISALPPSTGWCRSSGF